MSAPIVLAGRLADDPDLRFTQSGVALAKLTVVTSRRRKNQQSGEWEDIDTTFWPVTAWRQLAEEIANELKKGQAVVVSGSAFQNSWENKEGEKRSRIEVRADAAGPDLRWAKPSQRSSGKQEADPWAGPASDDEPPF